MKRGFVDLQILIFFGIISFSITNCTSTESSKKHTRKINIITSIDDKIISIDTLRKYLHYYSPIILKQADEFDSNHEGIDLISNFFYDNDSSLSNNKENWLLNLSDYIHSPSQSNWKIDPTVYSSAILFEDNSLGTYSAILLYHIYHAVQFTSIHDWERIEIRIDDISGIPGVKEQINYVTITRHSLHDTKRISDKNLNFLETPLGKHVLIWQASWNLGSETSQGELRFVEDNWADINKLITKNVSAQVNINESNKQSFHYIFANPCDSYVQEILNSKSISKNNINSLISGEGRQNMINFADVKTINYDLQDLADIIPTHLDSSNWKNGIKVDIVTPILNEEGKVIVDKGIHTFYTTAIDKTNLLENRKGYIGKHWFWGVYISGVDGDNFYSSLGEEPWYQHSYFAHNGKIGDGTVEYELNNCGLFLGKNDYKNWNFSEKGFDGRWYQLFKDK